MSVYPETGAENPSFDEVFPETPRPVKIWTFFSPSELRLEHYCYDGICLSPGAHRSPGFYPDPTPVKFEGPPVRGLDLHKSPTTSATSPFRATQIRSQAPRRSDDLDASLFGSGISLDLTDPWSRSQLGTFSTQRSYAYEPTIASETTRYTLAMGGHYQSPDDSSGVTTCTLANISSSFIIPPQLIAQEGISVRKLSFPDDRDQLVEYLVRGLSLRNLFPKEESEAEGGVVCKAELKLVGNEWRHSGTCNEHAATLDIYQRHIKREHLGRRLGTSLALEAILGAWGYHVSIGRPKAALQVLPWDEKRQPFAVWEPPDEE